MAHHTLQTGCNTMQEDDNIGRMSESDVEILRVQLKDAKTVLSWLMGGLSAIVMAFGGIFWQKQSDQHDALIKLIQQVDDLPHIDGADIKAVEHDLDEIKIRVSNLEHKS